VQPSAVTLIFEWALGQNFEFFGVAQEISGKDRTVISLGKGAVTAPLRVFSLIEVSLIGKFS